ncbi:NUDIX hydrolase [Acidianus ambivalens]|uniref:NUDIX domain-containing protein n=1 Tax=Acidianus ambivalens TaxID=2283 RepID=A0A650CXD0_ACIAM|nr:NUDIX hydrolase [Acidianus ambivalens]MQL54477.1 NUDIX domain-containing protein [Acidianus ambivalens]QGR22292.1 NUDIX domain-containing protein [Acidianus ambivalens]
MERPLIAVGGVIFSGKRVLLVQRSKPPNKGSWAIPGGKVEFGETLKEALKREMKEELNVNVEPKELLGVIEIIKEGFHYVILDFICEIKSGEIKAGSDALDAKFFSLEEMSKIPISPTTIEMIRRYFEGERTPLFVTEISK